MYPYSFCIVLTKNIFLWKCALFFICQNSVYFIVYNCLIFVKWIFHMFYVYLLCLWYKPYRFSMLYLGHIFFGQFFTDGLLFTPALPVFCLPTICLSHPWHLINISQRNRDAEDQRPVSLYLPWIKLLSYIRNKEIKSN